jgi:hypothetical protein
MQNQIETQLNKLRQNTALSEAENRVPTVRDGPVSMLKYLIKRQLHVLLSCSNDDKGE